MTIITIVRNAEEYIDRTLRSVAAQTYLNIQYIVIDGASTDGTVSRIRSSATRMDKFVSEPDSGISDAWNKGISWADGDIVGLLNAGDEYEPAAVELAVRGVSAGADVVYGDTKLVDEIGRTIMINRARFHPWWYSAGFGLYHPSVFARRSLYSTIGTFDSRYKLAMDSHWLSRAYMAGARFAHCGSMTRMVDGGISVRRRFEAYGEHLQAMVAAGMPPSFAYRSMVMTGLRGIARLSLPRKRFVQS